MIFVQESGAKQYLICLLQPSHNSSLFELPVAFDIGTVTLLGGGGKSSTGAGSFICCEENLFRWEYKDFYSKLLMKFNIIKLFVY